MSDIKQKITEIVLRVSSEASLNDDDDYDRSLSEIGVDSLDVMSVLLEIQEDLGISIPDEDVDNLSTVNLIINYVNDKLTK